MPITHTPHSQPYLDLMSSDRMTYGPLDVVDGDAAVQSESLSTQRYHNSTSSSSSSSSSSTKPSTFARKKTNNWSAEDEALRMELLVAKGAVQRRNSRWKHVSASAPATPDHHAGEHETSPAAVAIATATAARFLDWNTSTGGTPPQSVRPAAVPRGTQPAPPRVIDADAQTAPPPRGVDAGVQASHAANTRDAATDADAPAVRERGQQTASTACREAGVQHGASFTDGGAIVDPYAKLEEAELELARWKARARAAVTELKALKEKQEQEQQHKQHYADPSPRLPRPPSQDAAKRAARMAETVEARARKMAEEMSHDALDRAAQALDAAEASAKLVATLLAERGDNGKSPSPARMFGKDVTNARGR